MNTDGTQNRTGETPLESWKEIGAYLKRNEVTARRWEKEEGLPVHRHSHKARASVYAYPSEIDAWRASRKAVPEPVVRPLWKTPALALMLALCLVMVGNGIRPLGVVAQQPMQRARLVWTGTDADFTGQPSRDGKFLTFTDWQIGNLGVRDLATGRSRFVTQSKSVVDGYSDGSVPSPDGRFIAYRWHGGRISLRVISSSGGQPKTLPWGAGSAYGRPVAWTPDGKQVLIIRQLPDETNQLAFVSVQDGSSRTLKSLGWRYPRRVSLSPDGRFVAYDIPRENVLAYDVFVLAADGSSENAVADGPANDSDPVWSPDGSRLIFLSNRTGSDSLWTVNIRDGKAIGPAEELRKGVGRMYPLGMTQSGELYYFSGGAERNILLTALDENLKASGAPERISQRFVNDNARAAWSPDGESLAYYAPRGGAAMDVAAPVTLIVRSMKTGAEREVPAKLIPLGDETDGPPRWFPDGHSVMVSAMHSPGASPGVGYYRVNIETGDAQLLRSTRAAVSLARNPVLSSDGRTLYYFDDAFVRLDLASGKTTSLDPWLGDKGIQSWELSPDGSQLAFLAADRGAVSLEVIPSVGGISRRIAQFSNWGGVSLRGGLAWTPDSHYILFARSDTGDVRNTHMYSVPVSGGVPVKAGISQMSGFLTNPAMHPGGRHLTYSIRELGKSEVWVLENFLPN